MADISIGIWRNEKINEKGEKTISYSGTLPDNRKFTLYDNGPRGADDRRPQFNLKITDSKVQTANFSPVKAADDEIPF